VAKSPRGIERERHRLGCLRQIAHLDASVFKKAQDQRPSDVEGYAELVRSREGNRGLPHRDRGRDRIDRVGQRRGTALGFRFLAQHRHDGGRVEIHQTSPDISS
jgi:hypothetical protein